MNYVAYREEKAKRFLDSLKHGTRKGPEVLRFSVLNRFIEDNIHASEFI